LAIEITPQNDLSDDPAVAKKLPDEIVRPKTALAQFIEDNSKLVTSIAAFVALTALSSQLENDDAKLYISGLSLLAAMLLAIELLRQLPPEPHRGLLIPFSLLLAALVFAMGEYWVSRFKAVWVPIVTFVVLGFVFVVLPVLFIGFITKVIVLVSVHLFHRQMHAKLKTRIEQFGLLGFVGILFLCWLWVSYRFGGH